VPYIDWTFFFSAWELKGKYPAILDHPERGAAARELYENGRALLDRIIRERLLTPRAVYGFWPAASDGDDLVLFTRRSRTRERLRFAMLRQQGQQPDGKPNLCLADFVAPIDPVSPTTSVLSPSPRASRPTTSRAASRRTSTTTTRSWSRRSPTGSPRRSPSTCTRARGASGATARTSSSRARTLIAERYRGIRPRSAIPPARSHAQGPLFALLDAPSAGIELTESYAMRPAASVSGLYFAHPDARYFTVGRIDRDQVADYAARTGLSQAEASAGSRRTWATSPA
jgi:5-methyltetrahydrofolate--homocysteine methyltransferase